MKMLFLPLLLLVFVAGFAVGVVRHPSISRARRRALAWLMKRFSRRPSLAREHVHLLERATTNEPPKVNPPIVPPQRARMIARPKSNSTDASGNVITNPHVVHRVYDGAIRRGTQSDDLAACSDEWKRAMLAVGARLRRANVCAVVFVHGTFAGADPLALARVARAVPGVGASLESAVRAATKNGIDAILGDLGTFGESYVSLFERALGGNIPCSRFVWSSENHHAARLEGALDLLRAIATHARFGKKFRLGRAPHVLVVGHSHGAQLFALMSHLLNGTPEASAMFDILRTHGHALRHVEDAIRAAKRVRIDAVTFGTPPRYPWADAPNMAAIHIVSERGDYVRRLGARGSDLPSLSATARGMNNALDGIFGESGLSAKAVVRSVRGDVAVDPFGTTYFVDYQSAFGAFAGHGVYTKLDAMVFHATLAATHFYGANAPEKTSSVAKQGPRAGDRNDIASAKPAQSTAP